MSPAEENAKQVFLDAIEHYPLDQWPDYLDRICGDNLALRRRVEVLLEAHVAADNLLDGPVITPTAAMDQHISEKPGTQIGPYKLLEQIGEGGFGVVYMAEQSEPVERRVALKIIKLGMDTREVIARFAAEQQALAMMDHPSIAKVYDAGATDGGRPYFVMELVRGVPITHYCDQQHLSPQERLDLFISVCHAVQHAHQKGIIHRDLKPSNVLVALYDDQPVPKVIDFGVAKATSQTLTEKTMFTQYGQVVGTLEYMSPEQANLNQSDIDTRSDIYSLGVLLYELLTGTTPFDCQRLRSAGYEEMLRIIREEEPPKPSTRLSTSDKLSSVAADRKIEPKRLSTLVHGDLDWIVMKALEKDRARRYETANGLANDIQRYLNNEAVVACPPSAGYRFRKFARRNKATLSTVAVVVAALILGIVGTSWQAVRAWRAERVAVAERDRALDAEHTALEEAARADREATNARTEAAIAQAVNGFINNDLLGSAHPAAEPNRDLKVRDVLDRASQNIAGRFADQPLVKAAILFTIGHAYLGLGEYEKAQQHFERSRDLYHQELGLRNRHTLKVMNSLAIALQNQGRYEEAEKLHREVLDIRRELLGPEHPATLASLNNLANMRLFRKRCAEAEKLYRDLLTIQRRVLGPEDAGTLGTMNNLANAVGGQGRHEEAEKLHREVLDILRRVRGPAHPDTLGSMNNVANAIRDPRRYEEAERLHREVLDIRRQVLGAKHPDTIDSMYNLANTLIRQGRYEEAIAICTEATRLAPENRSMYTLRATTYLALGRYGDAVADCSRYMELEPDDAFVALMRAQALLLADRTEEYRQACVEMLDRFSQSGNAETWCHAARACVLSPGAVPDPMVPVKLAEQSVADNATVQALYTLAMAHLRAGQLDEAARRFQQSLGADPTWDAQFLDWLGLALVDHARGEEAASRQHLDKAVELMVPARDALQQDRLEGQLLRRELEQLLGTPEPENHQAESRKH